MNDCPTRDLRSTVPSLEEELRQQRRILRDVVALSALPSIWVDCDLDRSLQNVADVLRAALRAFTVSIRVDVRKGVRIDSIASQSLAHARDAQSDAPEFLESVRPDATELIDGVHVNGSGPLLALPHPIFFEGRLAGRFVAFYKSSTAPTQNDRLLLQVASNQVLLLLQRHKDQEELTSRKRFLQAVIDSTPDCIKLVDAEGTLLSINETGARMLQANSVDELVGKSIYPVIAPEHREAFQALNERVCAGEKSGLEFEVVGLRGAKRWMDTKATAIADAMSGRTVHLAITRDATERRAAEAELKRTTSQLSAFLETAALGLHRVGPDGTILWANRAEMQMLGYAPEEYIGRHISEFHADTATCNDILSKLTAGQTLADYEACLRCKDGTVKHVLIDSSVLWEDGQFVHTQCFTRDVTGTKRVQEALELSSRLPAENPAPVLRVDRNGILHFANPAAQELMMDWGVRIGNEAPVAIRELLGAGARTVEITLGDRSYSVAVAPVFHAEFTNLYFSDITERRRSEEALRRSEQHYRMLFDSIDQGFCTIQLIYDDHGTAIDYRFELVNPAFERHTGIKHAVGQRMRAIAPQHEAHWFETYAHIAKTGHGMRFENHATALGRTYEVYAWRIEPADSGKLGVLFNDITARKEAEKREHALQQKTQTATAKFEAVFNQSGIFAGIMDLDGYVLEVNVLALHACGYTREQVIGHLFWKTPWWAWSSEMQERIQAATETARGGNAFRETLTFRRADGEERLVDFAMHPIRSAAGEVIFLHPTGIDITDRARAERSLRENEAKLRVANELLANRAMQLDQLVEARTAEVRATVREIESFSYSVSHDLRGPLRAMQGYAEALLGDTSAFSAEQTLYLSRIQRAATRLDRLTQDVLAYSRISRADISLEPVSLTMLVEEIIDQYPNLSAARESFRVEKPLLDVLGNEAFLTQAISNLLSNGIKFVAPGRMPEVVVRTERRGEIVRLSVTDNGIGIDPRHNQRIFQMFGRIHPDSKYEGTGIGLATVKRSIERLNGVVGFDSEPGNGSTFWCDLPAALKGIGASPSCQGAMTSLKTLKG